MFDYNTNPIIPDKMQCAKVKCDYNLTKCVEGTNPFNEDGKGAEVRLNDKICPSGTKCYIGSIRNSLIPIYTNQNIEGTCKEIPNSKALRYPGEDCNATIPCREGSTCNKNKCSGSSFNETCDSDSQCLVGLYCDKVDKVCHNQKKEQESCEDSWECLNYLGCYKKKCQKFGTLDKNSIILPGDISFPGPTGIGRKSYMYKNLQMDIKSSYCIENDYYEETLAKLEPGEDFVKCNKGEFCTYWDGKKRSQQNLLVDSMKKVKGIVLYQMEE